MYLSRYVISKDSVILEIEPDTGTVLKQFDQPKDWKWDPERTKANWEEYDDKIFLVYIYEKNLIFQEGNHRFILGPDFSSKMIRKGSKWILFQLYQNGEKVYEFKYQDPQTRTHSILSALAFDDDWWDWDTPFEDVYKYLQKYS